MDQNEIKQRDRPGRLRRIAHILGKIWTDMVLVLAAAAITVGAALIYAPAGWITGGTLAAALAYVASGGGGDGG